MKTNRNISIDVELLNRVLKRLAFTPQTFTGLVENLLTKWDVAESRRTLQTKDAGK